MNDTTILRNGIEGDNISMADHCDNCGTPLSGQFCHQCGQSSRSMIKFFGEVFKEILDDVLGYDSRLKHSLFPLFFKPGQLTTEYVKGRRFYYVLPFRLYLFTSVLLMLLIQLTLNIGPVKNKTTSNAPATAIEKKLEKKIKAAKNKKKELAEITAGNAKAELKNEDKAKGFYFHVGENDGKRSGKFIEFSGSSGFIKQATDEINEKAKGWKKDPTPLIEEFLRLLPYMMFIVLPLFAVFSKLFYLFSKRFYIEHLIFSIHNHSFIFLVVSFNILVETLADYLAKKSFTGAATLSEILNWVSITIVLWIVGYVIAAVKQFYQQSWFMTLSKTISLAIIYLVLSSFGMFVTLIIGAYFA